MDWATPSFSRGAVNRAGDVLRDTVGDNPKAVRERDRALRVMDDWRGAHAFPMNSIQMTLRRRATKIAKSANVHQRLKRHPSIERKLQRFRDMDLSQMQDIGGCRAVMPSIKAAGSLVDVCRKGRGRSYITDVDDYIVEPKSDGYRGTHLIYKYRGSRDHLRVYDDLRIEVQIRTRLQHLWATTVEAVDLFEGQELKFGGGEDDWRRFFALMSQAICIEEERPPVPEVPSNASELVAEIRHWAHELHVLETLDTAQTLLTWDDFPKEFKNAKVFLLKVDLDEKVIHFRGFGRRAEAITDPVYLRVEKEAEGNPNVWVVFVAVDSLSQLKKAYPNAFLDTKAFRAILENLMTNGV